MLDLQDARMRKQRAIIKCFIILELNTKDTKGNTKHTKDFFNSPCPD